MRVPRPFLPASSKLRLLAAAFVWSSVGLGLAAVGTRWIVGSAGARAMPLLLTAAVAGWAKGRFLLQPRASTNAARIVDAPGPVSLASVFTPAAWLLVAGMMAGGYALRHSGLPGTVLGWIYAAAGGGLIVGSVPSWNAWASRGRGAPPPGVRSGGR